MAARPDGFYWQHMPRRGRKLAYFGGVVIENLKALTCHWPEGVLDRLAPVGHFFRVLVEPALNGFENMLVLPTRDLSDLARGTALLDRAALAGVRPIAVQDLPVLLGSKAVSE